MPDDIRPEVEGHPEEWEVVSVHTEKASRKGARRQGVSTQTIFRNKKTGKTVVKHTVTDDRGRIVDDHFRRHYRPRDGDLDDGT